MTLLKKTHIMELSSSILNMETFGEFGAPEALLTTPAANDLFEGLNWDLNTIPEGSFPSNTNYNPSIDQCLPLFQELDDIQEVMSPASSAGTESFVPGIETEFDPDQTQNLIDEVEEFLGRHENAAAGTSSSFAVKTEDALPVVMNTSDKSFNDSGIEPDIDMKSAESLLDALMNGNVIDTAASSPAPSQISTEDEEMPTINYSSPGLITAPQQPVAKTIDLSEIMSSGAANIVDCSKLTNVSEFVLEDGRNVIIMIAAPSNGGAKQPQALSMSENNEERSGHMGSNPNSPQASSVVSSDNDTEWVPGKVKSEKKRGSPRTAVPPPSALLKKPSGVGKRVKSTIIDKKERKKWQNVEAARRYRDKKKLEQSESELEVKMLEDKNSALKDKVGQMENELTTLKKLMSELGLLKNIHRI